MDLVRLGRLNPGSRPGLEPKTGASTPGAPSSIWLRMGMSRQVVAIVCGSLALAGVSVWSAGARPPIWLALGIPPIALAAIAWGLWGRDARRLDRDQSAARDAGWEAVKSLGIAPPAADGIPNWSALAGALARSKPEIAELVRTANRAHGWRALIDALGEPVLATDEGGRVILVNRAAERALGIRADDRPRVMDDLIAQRDVLSLHAEASDGHPASARVRIVAGDEARVYDTTATPLARPADDGSPRRWGVVLTFRDVTDLATAVQARTDFVANASHELRTPLAALRAAYDTLHMAIDDPRMRDRALQLAGNNLQRLEDMTRDLLDLSRMESPDAAVRISRVDVRDLLDEIVAPFDAARQARRLAFSIEVAPEARHADTDPRLVHEMLRNLVDNACRFAHEGTTIRLVAEAVAESATAANGRPSDATRSARATLRLRVIDRGVGIPLDQQARIFERFYQVDPARSGKRRGTGLGLSIVKHAARALGGSVDVESVWGQGTTMIVELPGAVAVSS